MKRVLLSLLIVAGVLYAGRALFFGSEQGGSSDQAAAVAVTSPSSAPSQQLAAEGLTPSPAGSRHAIEVEHAPLPSPSETSSGSTAISSVASNETPPNGAVEQPAFMMVTSPASIREGPSTSAAIVGVAQPGAEAQIVSRSTDWVEIIDPGSKKTGWIHESFLAPQAEPASRPIPQEEIASLAQPEDNAGAAEDDQQPSLQSKTRKHASRHRHRRHSIVLGPFILRFR